MQEQVFTPIRIFTQTVWFKRMARYCHKHHHYDKVEGLNGLHLNRLLNENLVLFVRQNSVILIKALQSLIMRSWQTGKGEIQFYFKLSLCFALHPV